MISSTWFKRLPFIIMGSTCLAILLTVWYENGLVVLKRKLHVNALKGKADNVVFHSHHLRGKGPSINGLQAGCVNANLHLRDLSRVLTTSIYRVQNPLNCKTARTFICNFAKLESFDFGLILHSIVACHLLAYGLGRVLIIADSPRTSFRDRIYGYLKPADEKCHKFVDVQKAVDLKDIALWKDMISVKDVMAINYNIDHSQIRGPYPPFVPGTMPGNLRKRLIGMHKEPDVWFIGHFVKYHLSRYKQSFAEELEMIAGNINLQSPVVGLYLQNKISRNGTVLTSEADYVEEIKQNVGFKPSTVGVLVKTGTSRSGSVNVPEIEYVEEASSYFEYYHPSAEKYQIFVASDDSGLVKYYSDIYKDRYEFKEIPRSVKVFPSHLVAKKNMQVMFHSLLIEIHLLVKSDFVICKFSSHICRIVYELKQAVSIDDGSEKVLSLDYTWGYEFPGYSWAPDLSILVMALKDGHFVDKEQISYLKGDMFDLFSWKSFNYSLGIDVLGVRQRNLSKPHVGRVPYSHFRVLINVSSEPAYAENGVFWL